MLYWYSTSWRGLTIRPPLLCTPLPSDQCSGRRPMLRSEPRLEMTTNTTLTRLLPPSSLTARFSGRKYFHNSVLLLRMRGVWVLICQPSLHWTMDTEAQSLPHHWTLCTAPPLLLLLILQWRINFVLRDIQWWGILTLWRPPLPVNMTASCCCLSSQTLSTDTTSLSSVTSLNLLHQIWLNSVKLRRSCSSTI